MKRTRFHIKTWGCQMNEHDSERYAGMFRQKGFEETQKLKDADIVLFNTCCVRENAERKVLGNIGRLKHFKKNRPDLRIIVAGCMMQQPHVIETIRKNLSFVDLILGTHNLHRFPDLLDEMLEVPRKPDPLIEVWEKAGAVVEGLPAERRYAYKAFVNIMFGCNNFCSYCIVPYTRGRERSRSREAILDEISRLAQEGVLEITLLGQNVNSYGKDLYEAYDFSDLLRDVDRIEGLRRIRFMTSHPKDATEKLIDAMASSPNVCESFHLPVQSGSDRILKHMNRHYTKRQFLDFAGKLRERMPGLSLSTDIIVGFPGETEEDFLETLDLVRQAAFDNAYTFLYSKRTGTKAAESPDQVPEEIKHRRFDTLLETLNTIAYAKNLERVGRIETVLVEGVSEKHPGLLHGRTRGNKIVSFLGSRDLVGTIVPVKITKAKRTGLEGETA